jgi:LmbE family N-acetylglucosaminyl deacetylase
MTKEKKMTELQFLPEDWERALAIVAHPDDLEYGAASAIARWTSQGKEISYLLVTRGEAGIDSMTPEEVGPLREVEQRKAAEIVGVRNVDFLDYQDGVIEYSLDLRRDMSRIIRRRRPDILISLNYHLTWGGVVLNMADHRWVGLAVLDAARDAGNRWIFPELLEEGLKPWNNVKMVCLSGSPQPTHVVDVTSSLDKGIASLKAHQAYIENLSGDFDPESFLSESASGTGKQVGCDYAVSFEVIQI